MKLIALFTAAAVTLAAPAAADTIDFGQFDNNTFNGTTEDGVAFSIAGPGAGLRILQQGTTWAGTFPTGYNVLFDEGVPGSVTFNFASALTSLSNFAVQANLYGPYTATLVASLGGTDVGTFTLTGVSAFAPGTAPEFAFSIVGGFDALVVSSTNDGAGIGIGNVTAIGGGGVVPEPATWAMMIGGFGIAGGALRRRRAVRTTVRFA